MPPNRIHVVISPDQSKLVIGDVLGSTFPREFEIGTIQPWKWTKLQSNRLILFETPCKGCCKSLHPCYDTFMETLSALSIFLLSGFQGLSPPFAKELVRLWARLFHNIWKMSVRFLIVIHSLIPPCIHFRVYTRRYLQFPFIRTHIAPSFLCKDFSRASYLHHSCFLCMFIFEPQFFFSILGSQTSYY